MKQCGRVNIVRSMLYNIDRMISIITYLDLFMDKPNEILSWPRSTLILRHMVP